MAAQGRLPVLISAYGKALDNLLSAQERVQKLQERAGELITAEFARRMLSKAWLPHLSRLRSLARRLAPKVTRIGDVEAETLINDEMEAVIAETQQAFIEPQSTTE